MTDQTLNNRKTIIVLILAAIAAIMFLLSLFYTSPIYQNSRLADPLAGVHSLSALYYASLVITALLGIGCFLFKVSSRYAQILLLNLPFMLFDFNAWAFFYVWQGTREPTVDGLSYLIYHYLGSGASTAFFPLLYVGTLSYLLFGRVTRGMQRLQSRSVTALKLFAPLLLTFLLANRIFSPQYILWILPFLALVSPVSLISFYIFEVANVLLTLLLFKYVADYPELAIVLRSVRYLALVAFYVQTLLSSRLRLNQSNHSG
ncbi:hypothetical protein ACFLWX_01375 [Chloroflexota bacterium]